MQQRLDIPVKPLLQYLQSWGLTGPRSKTSLLTIQDRVHQFSLSSKVERGVTFGIFPLPMQDVDILDYVDDRKCILDSSRAIEF